VPVTKFAPAINTAAPKSPPPPTLGMILHDLLTDLVANAKHSAVLLDRHHRSFDGEPECQGVIRRIEGILYSAAIALENVRDSMSEDTRKKLDTPRSLEIKHRAIG
jgi:hypothetical protein